jgi:hypothetical protein
MFNSLIVYLLIRHGQDSFATVGCYLSCMKFLIIFICYINFSLIFFKVYNYLAFSSTMLALIYIRKIRVGCISEKIPVKFLTLFRNEKNECFFNL